MDKVSFWVGWIFMICSWVIPIFIKNKEKKTIWAVILSALAVGVFAANFVDSIFKLQ